MTLNTNHTTPGNRILYGIITSFAVLVMLLPSFATGTVLLNDAELAQAKENVTREPLRAYMGKLSAGDGGSSAPELYLLTGERRYAEKARTLVMDDLAYLRKHIPYMVNIWILRSPGRVVSATLAYDMTKDSGVYSEEDLREIREALSWCIDHYLNRGTDHLGKGFITRPTTSRKTWRTGSSPT